MNPRRIGQAMYKLQDKIFLHELSKALEQKLLYVQDTGLSSFGFDFMGINEVETKTRWTYICLACRSTHNIEQFSLRNANLILEIFLYLAISNTIKNSYEKLKNLRDFNTRKFPSGKLFTIMDLFDFTPGVINIYIYILYNSWTNISENIRLSTVQYVEVRSYFSPIYILHIRSLFLWYIMIF